MKKHLLSLTVCVLSLSLFPLGIEAKTTPADILRLLRMNEALPISLEETMHERRDSRPLIAGAKGVVKEESICPKSIGADAQYGLEPACHYEAGSAPRFTEYRYTVSQRAASSSMDASRVDGEGTILVNKFETNEGYVVYPQVIPGVYGLAVMNSSSSELMAQARKFNRPYRFSWKFIGDVAYKNIQELPGAFWKLAEQEDRDLPLRLVGKWVQELPIEGLVNRSTETNYSVDLRESVQDMKRNLLTSPAYEIDPLSIKEMREASGKRSIQFAVRVKSAFVNEELRRRIQKLGGESNVSATRKRELRASVEHEKAQLQVTKMLFAIDPVSGHLLRSEARRTVEDRLPIGCTYQTKTKRDVCKNTMIRKVSQTGVTRFTYADQGPILAPVEWISSEQFVHQSEHAE